MHLSLAGGWVHTQVGHAFMNRLPEMVARKATLGQIGGALISKAYKPLHYHHCSLVSMRNAAGTDGADAAIHDEASIDLAWARVRAFFGLHLSTDPRVQEIPGGVNGPRRRAMQAKLLSEL